MLNRQLLLASLVLGWSPAVVMHASASQSTTASVVGTVTASTSGEPVPAATVTLVGRTLLAEGRSTETDATGAFTFDQLAPGTYRVRASRRGMVPAGDSPAFTVRDGEQHTARLRLPRLGVITGRVVDEHDQPMVNASVRAVQRSMAGGYPRLRVTAEALTDDRGLFRLDSLWPGTYLVCVSTRSTGPLDRAQEAQRQVDQAGRDDAVASRSGGVITAERATALEAQLPAQIEPVRGYAPACYTTGTGARASLAIGPDGNAPASTCVSRARGSPESRGPSPRCRLVRTTTS